MNKSIIEYDYVRAIAVLLVILGHCTYYKIVTDYGGIDYGINAEQSIAGVITNFFTLILYTFHMPLFIALSGCLWAVTIQKKGIPNLQYLIKNKIHRLLLPFILTAFFWSIPLKYLSGYWNTSFQESIHQMFYGQILMLGNSNSHLWFLQALFIIFILAYIVERHNLRKNKILFITSLCILSLIARYINLSLQFCILNIQNAFAYFIWFYIGFFFEYRRLEINEYIKKHVNWKISLTILAIYPILIFFNQKLPHGMGLSYISYYPLAIIGISITYILCYKISQMTSSHYHKHIKKISSNNYGLYLYSDPINYLIIYLIS